MEAVEAEADDMFLIASAITASLGSPRRIFKAASFSQCEPPVSNLFHKRGIQLTGVSAD